MKKILIIGATSAIAQASARLYCEQQVEFYLVGRNEKKLQIVGADLLTRGAEKVTCLPADLMSFNDSDNIINKAKICLEKIDIAIIAQGNITDQKVCEASPRRTIRSFMLNSLSVISLATSIANHFEDQQTGCLVVLSSIIGDRARASNYVNAAARASVNTFLDGLRCRFKSMSVEIITIKLAFVDTPLTERYKKNMLWSSPESIARGIKKVIEKKMSSVVYMPWFWRWHGFLIYVLPSRISKHLPL